MIMTSSLLFTIFYVLVSLCFVYPPNEFVSAGFTVQCLLSTWLGSENECFIQYHMRRIVATVLCHSILPLGKSISVLDHQHCVSYNVHMRKLVCVCGAMIGNRRLGH
jgi:hypothetical protein